MYQSIPDIIFVSAYYGKKYHNNFINKTVTRQQPVIGVSLPDVTIPRWAEDKKIMEEYAQSKGIALKTENAEYDAAKQAEQVDNLIAQGINVLILVPVDLSAAPALVEKAHKAGIKVVNYDRLIPNSDVDIFISFNARRIGELQGMYLIRAVPKGNYIILSGDPGNFNSKLYRDGAMDYIQPLVSMRDIKIVADKPVEKFDPKIAYEIVEDALIANKNKIDAILAPIDIIAGASIEALKIQGLAGKVAVTGQSSDLDAVRRIVEGTQLMTVFKDFRQEARTAVDTAIKLVTGEPIDLTGYVNNDKIDVPSILLIPTAVDKNNIKQVLIDSGFYSEKEVYGRKK
ncbi:MAG: substrate-binding domain-containing protein [Clostridiaceae bacterium]